MHIEFWNKEVFISFWGSTNFLARTDVFSYNSFLFCIYLNMNKVLRFFGELISFWNVTQLNVNSELAFIKSKLRWLGATNQNRQLIRIWTTRFRQRLQSDLDSNDKIRFQLELHLPVNIKNLVNLTIVDLIWSILTNFYMWSGPSNSKISD